MRIAVYCSSSTRIDPLYFNVARNAGALIAEGGHELIYGGGSVGLMGAIAEAVHERGGQVFGVIPEALKEKEGLAYHLADELIVTQTMQKRKSTMYRRADAFMVLPGGMGTLEEFLEVVTLKQLGYHQKPIVLINANGLFDTLLGYFDQLHEKNFTHEGSQDVYEGVPTPREGIDIIAAESVAQVTENGTG